MSEENDESNIVCPLIEKKINALTRILFIKSVHHIADQQQNRSDI